MQVEEKESRRDSIPFTVSKQLSYDSSALEAYIRVAMKPVLNNALDEEEQNVVSLSRLPIESIKRPYIQDFYRLLLEEDYLYNIISATPKDVDLTGLKLNTNYVKLEVSDGKLPTEAQRALNEVLGRIGTCSIKRSSFHSCIEQAATISKREAGLYDPPELVEKNSEEVDGSHLLFDLGTIDSVFEEQEKLLVEDVKREGKQLKFRPLVRRITELFARLSNIRLSYLIYTDNRPVYSKPTVVAALDIFYNLLSRISEAKRVHLDVPPDDSTEMILKLAHAAHYNHNQMQVLRPSVFVWGLMQNMVSWIDEKRNNSSNWESIKDTISNLSSNWFSRSILPTMKYDSASSDIDSTYTTDLSDPAGISGGAGHPSSFTGCHLGLIGVLDEDIPEELKKGLDALVDAFQACFDDSEVLKIYDPVANKATNLFDIMQTFVNSNKDPNDWNWTAPNVGEFQYALILERIFAKIYERLNVKLTSFMDTYRPEVVIDAALRFLTDSCLDTNNDAKVEEWKSHSSLSSYVEKVKELLADSVVKTTQGISDIDAAFTTKILSDILLSPSEGDESYNSDLYNWSLCPWRERYYGQTSDPENQNETAQSIVSISESEVGSQEEIKITNYKPHEVCQFSDAYYNNSQSQGAAPVTHTCKAENRFSELVKKFYNGGLTQVERSELTTLASNIPPLCPAYVHVKQFIEEKNLGALATETKTDAKKYLLSLFKDVEGNLGYSTLDGADYKNESDAQGYEDDTIPTISNSPYVDNKHSPIQIASLDHLVKFIQTLYKLNYYITFNEPYIKTKVQNVEPHEYASEDHVSFEPMTVYRFSNFHAQNVYTKVKDGSTYRLLAQGKGAKVPSIVAVNRDLSGDKDEKLDRGLPNQYYLYFKANDLSSGIISTDSTVTKDGDYALYNINPINPAYVDGDNLITYETVVKRFRPIFLPQVDDLFKLGDGIDSSIYKVYGWNIAPHKYTACSEFANAQIVVPMNISSHNSPRAPWFHELDYKYHDVVLNSSNKVVAGYYDRATRNFSSGLDISSPDSYTYEMMDFKYYNERGWMFPARWINMLSVASGHSAISPNSLKSADRTDACGNKLPPPSNPVGSEFIRGESLSASGMSCKDESTILTKDNIETFDTLIQNSSGKFDSWNDDDRCRAVISNWLYITCPAIQTTGSIVNKADKTSPWMFWHSCRGNAGESPSMFCYNLCEDSMGIGHDSGFSDGSMRCHAVDGVTYFTKMPTWDDSNNKEPAIGASGFKKGYYDPECAGTDIRWYTENIRYGCGKVNGEDDKGGPMWDKYCNPYKDGTHVLVKGTKESCSPFVEHNKKIQEAIEGLPMTWSLWNVIRQSICVYGDSEQGITYEMPISGNEVDEIEDKTLSQMRAMYNEWYIRFTNNGVYTSQAGSEASFNDAWPWYEKEGDPKTWGQAQTLCQNTTSTIGSKKPSFYKYTQCYYEWTNVFVKMTMVYNEVSDTHPSMVTFYTGGHPEKHIGGKFNTTFKFEGYGTDMNDVGSAGRDGTWGEEFRGKGYSTTTGASGAISTNVSDLLSGSRPFRYALPEIDMCRNMEAFVYSGYNSPPPVKSYADRAKSIPIYQPRSGFPSSLSPSVKIIKDGNVVRISGDYHSDISKTTAHDGKLSDYYPNANEGYDDEKFDETSCDIRLLPIYPNWESLHDASGYPLHPNDVTDDQFKGIIFALVPHLYYDVWYEGNNGKDGKRAQCGERMLGFCYEKFYFGDGIASGAQPSQEFLEELSNTTFKFVATGATNIQPGGKPWGQGLVGYTPSDTSWQKRP